MPMTTSIFFDIERKVSHSELTGSRFFLQKIICGMCVKTLNAMLVLCKNVNLCKNCNPTVGCGTFCRVRGVHYKQLHWDGDVVQLGALPPAELEGLHYKQLDWDGDVVQLCAVPPAKLEGLHYKQLDQDGDVAQLDAVPPAELEG